MKMMALPQQENSPSRPPWVMRTPRLALFGWVILMVLGFYVIRLWQLQFLEGGYYTAEAEEQQLRIESISPQRGVIFDRDGNLLVRNVPSYNIVVIPGELPEDRERERDVLQQLSHLIDVPYSGEAVAEPYQAESWTVGRAAVPPFGSPPKKGLIERVNEVRYLTPYAPVVVLENVERELALVVAQEGGVTLPGVGIQIVPRRTYPTGATTSHVVGFLRKIPPEAVEEFTAQGYNPNTDRIGAAGIEASVEQYLRGVPGRRYVQKDVLGQELGVRGEIEPIPGDNVYLTLDTQLQEVAEAALLEQLALTGNRRGVVVALDPRDGQVLSLVSLPTYDNNLFARGITRPEDVEAYQALLDDPHGPLFNHAIADRIPPGSIFKFIPATAALQEGTINRYTTINCPGIMYLPNKFAPDDRSLAQPFYCWISLQYGRGHGALNVVDALAQSCDIFFYQVGGGYSDTNFGGLGVRRLAAWSEAFGLGAPTGIDIPGEWQYPVPVPDDRWKREVYQETWTTGDTYIMSIGQGFMAFSPLQMVNALTAVANGGTLYQPQLIDRIVDAEGNVIRSFQPQVIGQLEVDDAVWAIVREGLEKTVYAGTAPGAQVEGVRVAGKTGTAEYCDDLALKAGLCPVPEGQTLPTHAWFIAYAPAEEPEIAVVAWIYNGGEGSQVAVPVAQTVLDFYFKRAAGLLPETEVEAEIQETPLEAPPPQP